MATMCESCLQKKSANHKKMRYFYVNYLQRCIFLQNHMAIDLSRRHLDIYHEMICVSKNQKTLTSLGLRSWQDWFICQHSMYRLHESIGSLQENTNHLTIFHQFKDQILLSALVISVVPMRDFEYNQLIEQGIFISSEKRVWESLPFLKI